MPSVDTLGPTIKNINSFIGGLDDAIKLRVFDILFDEDKKELSQHPSVVIAKARTDSDRGISPQELLRKCRVSSLMDKAVVLAYWLEEHQAKGSFTSADLKSAFSSAREPAPANPSDVVAKLEGGGKIMKTEKVGKAQYYQLTGTGMDQVNDWLRPQPSSDEK
ncbi:MAG: hypothetical protein QOJ64_3978 [Acidobacteriota bacterium]|jgi:hypothetical protein|nr:hypothetical protein [Acidobacteriota bacterium]